jgi:hypothetical protein
VLSVYRTATGKRKFKLLSSSAGKSLPSWHWAFVVDPQATIQQLLLLSTWRLVLFRDTWQWVVMLFDTLFTVDRRYSFHYLEQKLYVFVVVHVMLSCKYMLRNDQIRVNISISANIHHFFGVKTFKIISSSFPSVYNMYCYSYAWYCVVADQNFLLL